MSDSVRERKIAIFGAFDRFNYGDLLFPIILERTLIERGADAADIEFVGMRRSNLTRLGGVKTRAVRWLSSPGNLPDGSSVIMSGGEILGAGWAQLHCHHLPQLIGDFALRQLGKRISQKAADRFSQRYFGAGWPVPFVVRPEHFQNEVTTVYNAVGGTGLGELPEEWRREIEEAMGEARFASVRDEVTQGLVNRGGEVASLAADCAGVVGDMFPRERLVGRGVLSPVAERIIESSPRGYICFQLHRYFGSKRLKLFAAELDLFEKSTGIRVVLLPIGRASGHSDLISLKVIGESKPGDVSLVDAEIGVLDIMALLAHSQLVVASSLHAAITAMSYGVPFISFQKIPKCRAFLDCWGGGPFSETLDPPKLAEQMQQRLGTESQLSELTRKLRNSARGGLSAVADAVLC